MLTFCVTITYSMFMTKENSFIPFFLIVDSVCGGTFSCSANPAYTPVVIFSKIQNLSLCPFLCPSCSVGSKRCKKKTKNAKSLAWLNINVHQNSRLRCNSLLNYNKQMNAIRIFIQMENESSLTFLKVLPISVN